MTYRGYVAVDIETTEITGDMEQHPDEPLSILCGVTVEWTPDHGYEARRWYHGASSGAEPVETPMNSAEAAALLLYLRDRMKDGVVPVTFNGLGFDLKVLAHNSRLEAVAKTVARGHVDLYFAMLCQLGYACSLAKMGEAIGESKTEGIDGARVWTMWRDTSEPGDGVLRRKEVLGYCEQDALITARIFGEVCRSGSMCWVTAKGETKNVGQMVARERLAAKDIVITPMGKIDPEWPFQYAVRSVSGCYAIRRPDTSWMDKDRKGGGKRPDRDEVFGWLLRPAWWPEVVEAEAYDFSADPLIAHAVQMGGVVARVTPVPPPAVATGRIEPEPEAEPEPDAENGEIDWELLVDAAGTLTEICSRPGRIPDAGTAANYEYVFVRFRDGSYAVRSLREMSLPGFVPLDGLFMSDVPRVDPAGALRQLRALDAAFGEAMRGAGTAVTVTPAAPALVAYSADDL